MDWTQTCNPLITILGFLLGNAAIIIPLFLWTRSESREDVRHTQSIIESIRAEMRESRDQTTNLIFSIQQEMKDFHGRLEKQDAEFRARAEKQDAEFKAHLMHYHYKIDKTA